MASDIPVQCQKECRALQAFTSLLTLVEALAAIPDQQESTSTEEEDDFSPATTVGESLAEIANHVLGCQYVGVFAIDPPDERQRLLGVSGLTGEQEQRFRADTGQTPLTVYIDDTAIAQLHANEVVLLDLKHRPFMTPRSNYGARYRLVAPMVLHDQLVGFFTMAKTDAGHPDVYSAYLPEEIALAKGVAKLMAQVIERVNLWQKWAKAQANELALQEINRRYDAFLTLTSNELKSPLTSIKGNTQLVQRCIATLAQQSEQGAPELESFHRIQRLLEAAVLNSEKLERIIYELLDVSHIQTGSLVIVMQPCNLVEIVRHAVENARQTVTGCTLLLTLPEEESIPIVADAQRIGQVIANYLSNALKYSPARSPIEVSLTVEGSLARVAVRDEGPGLSLEDQARIWERFYRVPGTEVQYNLDANLGLGLYISREIIEAHQGHVGVHSTLGEGSTFWFSLSLTSAS